MLILRYYYHIILLYAIVSRRFLGCWDGHLLPSVIIMYFLTAPAVTQIGARLVASP